MRFFLAACLVLAGVAFGYRLAEYETPVPRAEAPVLRHEAPSPNGPVSMAVRNALAIPNPLERISTLAGLLATLPPSAQSQVTNAFDTYFVDKHETENVLFVEWWAQFDPEAAYGWTRSSYRGRHPRLLIAAIEGWARQDPLAAYEVVKDLPAMTKAREAGLLGLVHGWEDSGEPGLLEFVTTFPTSPARQAVFDDLVRRRILREGVDATVAWAKGMPENMPRRFAERLRLRVVTGIGEMDGERAAEIAAEWAAEARDPEMVRFATIDWSRKEPKAVVDWLSKLDLDPVLTRAAMREAYRQWLMRDQDEAHGWLLEQTLGGHMDPVMVLYVLSLAPNDPESALTFAKNINDEEERQATTLRALRTWYMLDPAASEAWMVREGISEKDRKRVKTIPRGMLSKEDRKRLNAVPPELLQGN